MPQRLASVDVGSNTVLMLLVEAPDPGREGTASSEPKVLADRAAITRLGQGLDRSQRLHPDAVARTLEVLARYGDEARAAGAAVKAVGTAALRRAEDGAAFLEAAQARLGAPIEVISGEREAQLAFAA